MGSDNMFKIEETTANNGARIVAIGVGGGGGNMIGHMINEGVDGIEMVVANTDAQVLQTSFAPVKIQMGSRLTKGLGAGMKPSVGKDSAIENYDDIRAAIEGADIVFIAAGLGGGTGTGAAPVIAQIARDLGALTISVVTKPFAFEGRKRLKLAEQGLAELKKESDSIVVIPNDKLLSIIDKNLGLKESFKIVDSILAQAVSGTSGVILSSGDNDINLDFADLKTVMCHHGMALMGVGEYQGDNAAYEAIRAAIESPLLDNMSINGAMGVLVHFTMHPDFPMVAIGEAMGVVEESADENADVIFGTTTDATLAIDYIKITLVATGFDHEETAKKAPSVNNDTYETPAQEAPAAGRTVTRPRMVVGGDLSDDYLDVPTYMRQQKD
ncbi:cell division protein FtsZ [Sulfurimonas sp. HSL-1656]|uniref:cell division protein FtsZ n=1 Tax=Thiomicrolovo subterrani TaxID=3131934 RepID=UPI0031F8094E